MVVGYDEDGVEDVEFPPITAPNLSPSDVMFLIDIWYEGEHLLSISFDGNEGNGTLVEKSRLLLPINSVNANVSPIELKLYESYAFQSQYHDIDINGAIYFVRLTDGKIICVSDFGSQRPAFTGCYGI